MRQKNTPSDFWRYDVASSNKQQRHFPFFNRSFDKKRLKLLLSWYYANKGEAAALNMVETLQKVGFTYAMKAGISLGIDDLKVPTAKVQFLEEAIESLNGTKADVYNGSVTAIEEFQQFIDTWHRTSENLKQSVVQNFTLGLLRGTLQNNNDVKAIASLSQHSTKNRKKKQSKEENKDIKKNFRSYGDTLNPVYMMAFSGARGNLSQVRQLVGMRGLMADPQGQLVEFPIQSNFREGLTVTEYMISCYGARKGLVDTALRTAAAGYLTRRLVDVSHHQVVRSITCSTKDGIWLRSTKSVMLENQEKNHNNALPPAWKIPLNNPEKKVTKPAKLAKLLVLPLLQSKDQNKQNKQKPVVNCIGRVLARDIPGVAFRNQEIDISLGATPLLREVYENFGIYVRSPLTCKADTGICQLCYGWSVSANKLVGIGEAVGVIAAQSIGEPGTQLTMRTFHTGGVFSGDIMEECRAKHAGTVHFQSAYLGLLVRTEGGRIAFCIKTPGVIQVIGAETQTSYSVAANTLLFVRQGEKVITDNLLAQIPNLPNIEQKPGESTKTISSALSGEIRETPTISSKLGNIRILSGQKQMRSKSSLNLLPGSHRLGRCAIPSIQPYFLRSNASKTIKPKSKISPPFFCEASQKTQLLLDLRYFFTSIVITRAIKCKHLPLSHKLVKTPVLEKYLKSGKLLNCAYLFWTQSFLTFLKYGMSIQKGLSLSKFHCRANPNWVGPLEKKSDCLSFTTVDINNIRKKRKAKWAKSSLVTSDSFLRCLPFAKQGAGSSFFAFRIKQFGPTANSKKQVAEEAKDNYYGQYVPLASQVQGKGHILLGGAALQSFGLCKARSSNSEKGELFPIQEMSPKYMDRVPRKFFPKGAFNLVLTHDDRVSYNLIRRKGSQVASVTNWTQADGTVPNKPSTVAVTGFAPLVSTNFDSQTKSSASLQNRSTPSKNLLNGFPTQSFSELLPKAYETASPSSSAKEQHEKVEEAVASFMKQEVEKAKSVQKQVGSFVNQKEELLKDLGSSYCGQIIEKSSSQITLRLAQNILYSHYSYKAKSSSGFLQSKKQVTAKVHPDLKKWIYKGTPVVTLPYSSSVTGDIVAGIPKIEQLFEARGEALEEAVETLWANYEYKIRPKSKAVRDCFKEIGLFVVQAIQGVYLSQGVHIADKHLEVIVRQMTRRACITDPGDTSFLSEEFVDLQTIECVNWTTYGKSASYKPRLIGITRASLNSNSFLSSASFQQTARVLERETFKDKTDRLLGLKERVMIGAIINAGTGDFRPEVRFNKSTNIYNFSSISIRKKSQSLFS